MSGVARAAVAALGADASLAGSALESCRGLIRAPDAGVSSTDRAEPSLCECDGKWSLCANRLEDLEPALVGFPECDPEKSACVRSCVTDLTSAAEGTPLQIPRWVTWLPDRDGMAFSVADDQGCATSPAPASDYRAIAARGGYTPSVGLFRGLAPGSYVAPASALVVQNAFGLQLLFFPTRELPDARNAAFVAFGVCQPPVGPFTERDELCFGHGVEGASGELLDAAGAPIGASWAIPAYFADGTAQPDPERRTVGKNAYGYFYNVPAGRYLLRVHPPAGKSMSCTLDPATGGGLGWPAQQPNTYRVEAEAGLNNFVARVFCELT